MSVQQSGSALFVDRVSSFLSRGELLGVTFSSPRGGEVLRVKGTPRLVSGSTVLQIEEQCTEGRVRHRNLSQDELPEAFDAYLSVFRNAAVRHSSGGSGSLMISKNGRETYTEDARLRNFPSKGTAFSPELPLPSNDREKNRLLRGDEPFLIALGISDKDGRVHDKKQAKFRQICRFAEQVRDIMKYLPAEGTIRVADLCSGKSYLSFAVYHCLTVLWHRDVEMTCVDLKDSVMRECAAIASTVGFDGMTFLSRNIDEYNPAEHPHLVVSLHACDTATDIVLRYAASHGAGVILSTPCCHRALSREINCEPLAFVNSYGILRDKFCTAATDGLRLLYLQASGYRTDAIELIDPEDTPKNVLLRAIRQKTFRTDSAEAEKARSDYRDAYRFLTGKETDLF